MAKELSDFEKNIGYRFKNKDLKSVKILIYLHMHFSLLKHNLSMLLLHFHHVLQ